MRDSLRSACTGGIGAACHRLGELLAAAGESSEAAGHFGLACDRKHPLGCKRFADRLRAGDGAAQDPGFAAKLYEGACRAEVADACRSLAEMHRQGEAVERDTSRAADLERRADELEATSEPPSTSSGRRRL